MEILTLDKTFDSAKFVRSVGASLVTEFEKARSATTPELVASAMETAARQRLEQILPSGVGVGTGCVIDTYGNTSRQTDVILYERDVCPAFRVNDDDPKATYYPCEGVIAVGEVKSTLDRGSLEDAFRKIASVKKLQRRAVHHFMPNPTSGEPIVEYRKYGSLQTPSIVDIAERQNPDGTDQIFGFVVGGDLRVKPETFRDAFREFSRETGNQSSPNMVAVLGGGLLTWGNLAKVKHRETKWFDQTNSFGVSETTGTDIGWETRWSAQGSSLFRYSQEEEAFRTLVRWIRELYRTGKTSDSRAFDHYFLRKDNPVALTPVYIPMEDITLGEFLQRIRAGQ